MSCRDTKFSLEYIFSAFIGNHKLHKELYCKFLSAMINVSMNFTLQNSKNKGLEDQGGNMEAFVTLRKGTI